jgi:undecaprenyl diphosphate synthase
MIEAIRRHGGGDAAPRHVAIIMDGNRRWAKEHGLSPIEGHAAGGRRLRAIVRTAKRFGVEIVTVYAFSEENWRRDKHEVTLLMDLLRSFAERERESLRRENVRVTAIGRLDGLPEATREAVRALCEATSGNTGIVLNLALNYGARRELCDAIAALTADVAAGKLDPADIDDGALSRYLYTAGMPDPDLVIRTGGELRLSNFLLYQIAYAELWSTPVRWPDFDDGLFEEALGAFATRQRRFGT